MPSITLHTSAQRTGPIEQISIFCGDSERAARRATRTARGDLYVVNSWSRKNTQNGELLVVDFLPDPRPVARFCYVPGYGGGKKYFFLFPITGDFEGSCPTTMRVGESNYLEFPSYLLAVQLKSGLGKRSKPVYLFVVPQLCREDEWIQGLKASQWTADAFNQILLREEDELAALQTLERYLDVLTKAQDQDRPGISTFVKFTLQDLPTMPPGMSIPELGWGATTVLKQGLPRPPNSFYRKGVV